ncbi:MAG: CehA/McbA family metallohydrolase [Acidobacteriota bacterium]
MTSRLLTLSIGVFVAAVVVLDHVPTPAVAASPDVVTLSGVLTSADRDWGGERTFIVPSGTSAIDIDLTCPDGEPESLLDFGVGGPSGLRGWSTARHDHVHLDALSASLGYLPGPIEAGQWRVLLGAPPRRDGSNTAYQITVRLSNGPAPTWPVLRASPGWFAGDLHVHSGHSDGYRDDPRGRQRPVLVRDVIAAGSAAQLDFLAITDHNTASHWVDIDRAQAASPTLLLLHGREITTARGHFNAIGERRFTDFRLGPRRPMSTLLEQVARNGAFVSINHAWLSSSDWCNGCGWADRDAETMQRVAGIEVLNGSTPTRGIAGPGWAFWADRLEHGQHAVPVGGSDVHDPFEGRASLRSPATVVWASALSEEAIVAGLKSGRVFVRASPGSKSVLDLTARSAQTTVGMGQTIGPGRVTLAAHVTGSARQQCYWIRRGHKSEPVDLLSDDDTTTLTVDAVSGDWFSVIVSRDGQPQLISNAVFVKN